MEKKSTTKISSKMLLFIALVLCGLITKAQPIVLVPASGSNTIQCGTNSILQDDGGTGNYANGDNGYTVIFAGFAAQITINGPFQVEQSFDYIRIYDGVGTGGTLLQTFNNPSSGTINYTGAPGQTLTVQFTSDGSVVYSGFDLSITFNGPCFNIPCTTTPSANAVVAPTTAICPNSSANLTSAYQYTVGGITYQWQSSSTSSVGPYTSIPTGTNTYYATPNLTTTTWYQVVATCTNGGSPTTYAIGQVSVSPVIISNVPYYEGFEGITANNQLPNCSWTKNNNVTCQTYISPNNQNRIPRTGNKFASFYYTPAVTNIFYTNGIQMYAGVTYSASMFFTTEYYGYNTWNLDMMVGPNQTTVGLVSVANLTYAASPSYKQLNNTFTVPTSGIYYVAIKGISNGVCCGYYLSWDDLSVTIPCQLNTPTVSIAAAGSTTICAGQSVNLTASGANTYTWNTGATTSVITDSPLYDVTYTSMGTSSLTNCMATATKFVKVNPSPAVSIVPSATAVCEGSPVNMVAFGASTYTWNTSATGNFVTVTPLTSGPYNVIGANSFNCTGTATQMITVNQLPTITAQNAPATTCIGADVTLTGGGGVSYQWMANNAYVQGSPVVVNPNGTTTYSLTGTDVNGCSNMITITQQVFNCVGINEHAASLNGLSIYPNPNNGDFNIELKNGLSKTIEIMDVTGRVILSENRSEDVVNVNINNLANGIYYVKVKSDNAFEVLKVVKQ